MTPTQKTIAHRLGVSVSTVSKALQGHPRVAAATRRRVREAAAELGYVPDPMMTALSAYRRAGRKGTAGRCIGWVQVHSPQVDFARFPGYADYRSGAAERAAELGYRLETFGVGAGRLSEERMGEVLTSRGIEHVVVAPLPTPGGSLSLPWDSISAVTIGFTLRQPRLNVVTNDHFQTLIILLEALHRRGYRRPGLYLWKPDNDRMGRRMQSAFAAYSSGRNLPLVLYEQADRDFVLGWIRAKKLDSLITRDRDCVGWLRAAGIGVPDDFGLVHYALETGEKQLSGAYHNNLAIGAAAVDWTIRLSHRHEKGLPRTPHRLLIDSQWIEGSTVRGFYC